MFSNFLKTKLFSEPEFNYHKIHKKVLKNQLFDKFNLENFYFSHSYKSIINDYEKISEILSKLIILIETIYFNNKKSKFSWLSKNPELSGDEKSFGLFYN